MNVYGIVVGLLLTIPWILFGIVVLGAASSAVGRWLGRRRRPYRVGRSERPIPSQAKGEVDEVPKRVMTAGTSLARSQRSPREGDQEKERLAA